MTNSENVLLAHLYRSLAGEGRRVVKQLLHTSKAAAAAAGCSPAGVEGGFDKRPGVGGILPRRMQHDKYSCG